MWTRRAQIQALDRAQPVLPLAPGIPQRRTRAYERHGTTTLFAARDVATGKVVSETRCRPRGAEVLQFLHSVEVNVPATLDIHLVTASYTTDATMLTRKPMHTVHRTCSAIAYLRVPCPIANETL